MPWSVRLTQLVFALTGLSTLLQLVRLLNEPDQGPRVTTTLAVPWLTGVVVVVAAALLTLALQLHWTHARVLAVAMLVLEAVGALWRGPSALHWSQAFSLSGAGARGEVLGYSLWILLVLVLAARLVWGGQERRYFATRKTGTPPGDRGNGWSDEAT